MSAEHAQEARAAFIDDFAADFRRVLLAGDAPAQVHVHEMDDAEQLLTQARGYKADKVVGFRLHVAEGGGDEDADGLPGSHLISCSLSSGRRASSFRHLRESSGGLGVSLKSLTELLQVPLRVGYENPNIRGRVANANDSLSAIVAALRASYRWFSLETFPVQTAFALEIPIAQGIDPIGWLDDLIPSLAIAHI